MHLMVSFLTGLELMTMITLMVITMMMANDFMVHEEYEADQYTSIGKKGQQKWSKWQEIQKIVTSAGWLDQCQDGPHQWSLQN